MAKGFKVYTASWQAVINAGLSFVSNFAIDSPQNEIKIRSIYWDLNTINLTSGQKLLKDDPLLSTYLALQNTGPIIAHSFVIYSGPPYAMGQILNLYNPGEQLIFDSFYISGNLQLSLFIDNLSAADQVQSNATVIIETEQKNYFR